MEAGAGEIEMDGSSTLSSPTAQSETSGGESCAYDDSNNDLALDEEDTTPAGGVGDQEAFTISDSQDEDDEVGDDSEPVIV